MGPFLNFRNAFPFPFLLEKRNAFPFFIPSWKKECIPIPIPWKKEWFFFPFFFHSFLPKKSWENRPKKLAVFYNGSGLTLGDLKYRFHQKIQSSFWFIGSIGPLNKAILRIFSRGGTSLTRPGPGPGPSKFFRAFLGSKLEFLNRA